MQCAGRRATHPSGARALLRRESQCTRVGPARPPALDALARAHLRPPDPPSPTRACPLARLRGAAQWRDLRVSLLRRQHQRAASQIEHLWRTDERYHLATLRRHRPRDRSAGASPFFTLHVEHTDELILRADRDLLGRGFVISCPRPRAPGEAGGAEREGGRHGKPLGPLLNATRASVLDDASRMQYVGHLIGTASFATFTMYDHGLPPPMPPSGMRSAPQRYSPEAAGPPPCSTADMARRELAHITLRHSLWAARCISVAIPAEPGAADDAEGAGRERADSADTSELVFAPVSPATPPSTPGAPASPRGSTLAQRARRKEWRLDADAGVQLLHNAVPSWNSDLSAFTLPFYGRVHLASKKNFQLIDRRRPDVVVMIFGKSRRDVYSLDWCHPLSCLQAIGIALSSFDSCLAGRKSG